jgi:hypothetical protein
VAQPVSRPRPPVRRTLAAVTEPRGMAALVLTVAVVLALAVLVLPRPDA